MKFMLETDLPAAPASFDYTMPVVVVGSCFAQNIGAEMSRRRFPVEINPCGAVYNPLSIKRCFELLTDRASCTYDDLVRYGDRWISFSHSTQFSFPDQEQTYQAIHQRLDRGREALSRARWIIITLGTAWVYRLNATDQIVSNCHKLPEREFTRSRLTVDETITALSELFSWPEITGKTVIITVSPVRYVKDTLSGNNLSKATLLLAAEALTRRFPNVHYFPAYELIIDELRDYRFYESDRVHPSAEAVRYVWEKFQPWAFTSDCRGLMSHIERFRSAVEHRPFDRAGDPYRRFKQKMHAEIGAFSDQHPEIDLSDELAFFES